MPRNHRVSSQNLIACRSLGAGIATNGVFIYNPLTSGNKNAVDGTDQEQFDLCDGHPDPQQQYHTTTSCPRDASTG